MIITRCLATILLFALLVTARAQTGDEALDLRDDLPAQDQLQPYADGIVGAMLREHRVPGLVLAVTDTDRDLLLKGYGQVDATGERPADASQTMFRIGSISKTFTWTAVMMLVERGQLDLDRDVNDYLRDFKIEDAFDAPVTMNDLMAHRAGFEDSLRVFQFTDDDPRSLGDILALTQPARVFPRGQRTSYSNWGSALAAHIVEVVDGRPYMEILDSDILRPLAMDRTTLLAPSQLGQDQAAGMSEGLRRVEGRIETSDTMQIGPFAPAGAMASTASDMARWMRFHLNGGELDGTRLMSAATHARMLTRHFNDRPGAADLAHGFQTFQIHGVSVFGHAGSTGNFHSRMLFVPALNFGVFASQNSGSGGYATVNTLTELLIERELRSAGISTASALTPAEASRSLAPYAGDYRNNRRSHTTLTAVFSIAPTLSVRAADDGTLIVQQSGTSTRYYPTAIADDLFIDELGHRLHFQRNSNGDVIAVNDGSGVHSHERISPSGMPLALLLPALLALGLSVTTLLGVWKRWRRPGESTAAGRRAAWRVRLAALGVLVYGGLGLVAVISVSRLDVATLRDFPGTSVVVFSAAGWALLAITAILLSGLIPAWRGSRWPILRRLHYTLFALTLAVLCAQLWTWNLFGADII
jgi:CubicO group peptidase (beta-lactamase class C family)